MFVVVGALLPVMREDCAYENGGLGFTVDWVANEPTPVPVPSLVSRGNGGVGY